PAAYKPDLAACLHNLATCLSDVGDRSAALAAIRETAEIRRELAARDPATHAPALAPCLHRLTKRLAEAGHRGEALETAREAVAAYR
ncbi:tetratricopeptide repeat protein, partial [Klebsiella pneumoniae]|nr:tetratricopeptide repeat protein [Klebsiella pneumoniae]